MLIEEVTALSPASASQTSENPERDGMVQAMIQRSGQIATLPAVAIQIIRLSEDPDSTIEDLNKVIANDPALGVRILKLINSAYYGMSGQVTSINRALLLLGLKAVKNIAVAASLVKMFRGGQITAKFSASNLWTHSIAVAAGTRILAARSKLTSPDEAFLAGLIHDIGILVELQASGAQFIQVLHKVEADPSLTFRAAEESVLGASHEAIGAGLCKAWKFPPSLQFVAGFHHRPWELPEENRILPTLVHIADVLVARAGLGYTRTVEAEGVEPWIAASVNLTPADLDAAVEGLAEAMSESQSLFSDGK